MLRFKEIDLYNEVRKPCLFSNERRWPVFSCCVRRSVLFSLSLSLSPRVFLSTVRGRICSENESDFARSLTPEKTEETQKEANTATMAIGHHGWTEE